VDKLYVIKRYDTSNPEFSWSVNTAASLRSFLAPVSVSAFKTTSPISNKDKGSLFFLLVYNVFIRPAIKVVLQV
jgi:hypothetical protein